MLNKRKYFTKFKELIPLPNLIENQINSFNWFLKQGVKEVLDEISPIQDYSGKVTLSFGDYYFDEPKYDENTAKQRNITYEAPLRCNVKLDYLLPQEDETKKITFNSSPKHKQQNKFFTKPANKTKTKLRENIQTLEQEIYLGDFPIITPRGTFIINGIERVVVGQLIRSPGAFFTPSARFTIVSEKDLSNRTKQFFGVKIIPNRGAWLEFETDNKGVIWARIDRKRKVAVTSLLRAFSNQGKVKAETDQDIINLFKDIDTDEQIKFIQETIKKDTAKNLEQGLQELYRRIRPGELASVDNSRSMIFNMFFNEERYDLGRVGRYKFNQRLKSSQKKYLKLSNKKLLCLEDIVLAIREIIRLNNNPMAQGDDIDHLGNRRVRTVGELVQNRFRIGLTRMQRNIRDKMTSLDLSSIALAQLINARPLTIAVKEFFASSQLSQFMDQVNPLAELEHKRRLSAMGPGGLTRERATFDVRDVHTSHYGRICPIQSSEGQNIGLVAYLSCYAKINDLGFIETPYQRVKNGKVLNKIVYLDAFEEEKVNIAHANVKMDKNIIIDNPVQARIKSKSGLIAKSKIDYIDISPKQAISIATSLIPFLEHDDAQRALMGSNMQRQAVACVRSDSPIVGTGIEHRAAMDSGQVLVSQNNGKVIEADASRIVIKTNKNKIETHKLQNFIRSNTDTALNQTALVQKGDIIKKNQIIADGASSKNGELALGQNLLVAFMAWEGWNYEDAIVISSRLLRDDTYTSVHIEDFNIDVRDTKLGPEVTTRDIPNIGEEKLKDLDEEGIIRIGAQVKSGDILVGKISPKGESSLTAEERLLRAIFGDKARDVKDTALLLPHGKHGKIVDVKIFSRDRGDKLPSGVLRSIHVSVAQLRNIQVGDKLAGRHGNKGVIASIVNEEDMPYLSDGTPVDIILSPLGVVSRMNIGQILETHLGWAAKELGYKVASPVLDGISEEKIKQELKKADLPKNGKVKLYDGRTGEAFENETTIGYIYIMKLNHLVEDKIHMRSTGPYSLITQQPLGGKAQFGGQRFGEMEVWALEGYGAANTLQEMLTIKSDDVLGRSHAYEAIIKGKPIAKPNIPTSFHVLVQELKALGLSVEFEK